VTFETGCGISALGESAFYGCSSLQSICIPSSVEIIGKSCFDYCDCPITLVLEAGCRLCAETVLDFRLNWKISLKSAQ
jgi:hypothetical protein